MGNREVSHETMERSIPGKLLGPVENSAISAGLAGAHGAKPRPIGGDAVSTLYQLLKIVLADWPSLVHNSESANCSYSF
jgi:hypothetical protein